MWYKIAQQFENITKSRSPSSLSGNQQGISVNFQDYQQLKSFGTGSGPITVQDIETKQPVTVVHGGLDPEGNFAFSKGNGEFVYPKDNPTGVPYTVVMGGLINDQFIDSNFKPIFDIICLDDKNLIFEVDQIK
jgi:hypothetical protein